MEDWEKAITLEEFIKNHVPKGYREPISNFDFVPTISASDYIVFVNVYKNSVLTDYLKSYKRFFGGIIRFPFNKPYIIDAITAYFDNKGV